MRIHDDGVKSAPVMIMLPGSFCNADSMANVISRLETEYRILTVDYSGQYAESDNRLLFSDSFDNMGIQGEN